MEEPHHHDQDPKCPARKLDFNLPLLSTRRHDHCDEQLSSTTTASNSINLPHHDHRHRIPFCWERAPGRPKTRPVNADEEDYTPRLRLPPCRWHPEANDVVSSHNDAEEQDDGCDADVDEEYDEGDSHTYNNNYYSNAYMDALSLTEAIDIAQRGDGYGGGEFGRRERFSVSSSRNGDDGYAGGGRSPNFMMERFLPDATALAASSVLYATNKMLPFYSSAAREVEEGYGRSGPYSCSPAAESTVVSQKGCGLDSLFPWRTKHKLCNAKSPVRQVVSPTPAQPPRLSAKQKRDHRSSGT